MDPFFSTEKREKESRVFVHILVSFESPPGISFEQSAFFLFFVMLWVHVLTDIIYFLAKKGTHSHLICLHSGHHESETSGYEKMRAKTTFCWQISVGFFDVCARTNNIYYGQISREAIINSQSLLFFFPPSSSPLIVSIQTTIDWIGRGGERAIDPTLDVPF